jgi:hypothetical protein
VKLPATRFDETCLSPRFSAFIDISARGNITCRNCRMRTFCEHKTLFQGDYDYAELTHDDDFVAIVHTRYGYYIFIIN